MPGEARQLLKNAVEAAAAEAKAGKSTHTAVQVGGYKAPGRLGDPGMELKDEPRVNPKLLAAVTPIGMDRFGAPPGLSKLTADSSLDEIAELVAEFEVRAISSSRPSNHSLTMFSLAIARYHDGLWWPGGSAGYSA